MIPILGILSGIGFIIAFTIELVGLFQLRNSVSIGVEGKSGALLLVYSMFLAIFVALSGMLPFIGSFISSFFALGALVLIFMGWTKVQRGILETI